MMLPTALQEKFSFVLSSLAKLDWKGHEVKKVEEGCSLCLWLTYLPSIAQRHHVVNINIGSGCPGCAIKWTVPPATDSGAAGILHHVGAVTLQHHFSGVASSGLGAPVGKEITAVSSLGAHWGYAKSSKLAARSGARGDIGWDGRWIGNWVGIRAEHREEEWEKDERRLHLGCR